jgi:DNA-binding beta-propeller fold protein YncE
MGKIYFITITVVFFVSLSLAAFPTELPNDSSTTLLLHFNGNLNGASGETPTLSAGTSYVTGLINQAVHTGNPGYIRYAKSGNITSSQGTVEFWFKPDWNGNLGIGHIFFQVGGYFNNGMILSIDGANNLRFIQWGDDPDTTEVEIGSERGTDASGYNWIAGNWYHVAATWNGAARQMTFYINGQPVSTINNNITISDFSTTYLSIGAQVDTGAPAQGAFEEFRISNRARNAGEILEGYNTTLGIIALNGAYGICTDSANRTIVAESGGNRITVFDSSGVKQYSFGAYGGGLGQMNQPWDVSTDQNDNIYVTDMGNNIVQIFASNSLYIDQFGNPGTNPGQFNAPKGIFFDKANAKIYVADTGNQRVQRFNSDYSIDTTWSGDGVVGTTGVLKRDHTGFDQPMDVAVNPVNSNVYVADYGNCRIEVFNANGVYQKTYLAVYHSTSLAFDSSGNLYIAGEDPNNGYTYYDGRLRLLKAGEDLISSHYAGGLDDIGRIEGGVAVRGDGAIIFTDVLNARIVKTDSAFTRPITDLKINAQGSSMTFTWKTSQPCSSSVRYGTTSAYGSVVSDPTITTNHQVVVTGQTPNTRLYYGVSFADSFDGTQRWTPQDVINTGANPGQVQFMRLKTAGMIYLDKDSGAAYTPMTAGELQEMRDRFNTMAKYYWINSGFRLWLDYTVVEVSRNITDGAFWIWSTMESDLTAAGYSAADDFDLVTCAAYTCTGNFGGGGGLFGRGIGTCQWISMNDFVGIHEANHAVDSIYAGNDLGKYEFNHGIWAVPNWIGRDYAINGQILRNMLPANYAATRTPYTKVMTSPDADNDGFADSSPGGLTEPLAVTEATFGSSTASADTDSDGVGDLQEAMALVFNGTNPNSADSDGDGVLDKNDLNPAYQIRDHIGKGTPVIDGIIGTVTKYTVITNKWGYSNTGLVSDNNSYQSQTMTYAAWDDNYLYLALKGPSTTATVYVDGGADNWFIGPDNYWLTLTNGYLSKSVNINVGVPDIFRQIDNDGQWSEIFDTNPMFSSPYQGRTTYNNPGDGLGFAGRLVTEDDIIYAVGGSGQNCVWEIAIPWSNKTLLKGFNGKEIAIYFQLSGDYLFETDHFAKLKLVDIGAPQITNITYSAGAARITFDCTAGVVYNVYYRDSMDSTWTLIQQVTGQGAGTVFVDDGIATDPDPVAATERFYRIGM